jgi:hypothetical protein
MDPSSEKGAGYDWVPDTRKKVESLSRVDSEKLRRIIKLVEKCPPNAVLPDYIEKTKESYTSKNKKDSMLFLIGFLMVIHERAKDEEAYKERTKALNTMYAMRAPVKRPSKAKNPNAIPSPMREQSSNVEEMEEASTPPSPSSVKSVEINQSTGRLASMILWKLCGNMHTKPETFKKYTEGFKEPTTVQYVGPKDMVTWHPALSPFILIVGCETYNVVITCTDGLVYVMAHDVGLQPMPDATVLVCSCTIDTQTQSLRVLIFDADKIPVNGKSRTQLNTQERYGDLLSFYESMKELSQVDEGLFTLQWLGYYYSASESFMPKTPGKVAFPVGHEIGGLISTREDPLKPVKVLPYKKDEDSEESEGSECGSPDRVNWERWDDQRTQKALETQKTQETLLARDLAKRLEILEKQEAEEALGHNPWPEVPKTPNADRYTDGTEEHGASHVDSYPPTPPTPPTPA